ncbi:major facilitator super transporter protein, partial [Coemansia sp. RSA 2618]
MRWIYAGALSLLLVVELAGLGLFAKGFFPYKKSIPGFAGYETQPPDIGQMPATAQQHALDNKTSAIPQYDRLVLVLVDALRNDFVFGNESGMAYTQELLRSGMALG